VELVRIIAGPILQHDEGVHQIEADDTGDLIVASAVISGLSGLLAEKLLLLEGKTLEDMQSSGEDRKL
ncbi:MAG: hypothetical protein HUJ65_05295, partial [Oscillospiraceae bacterium]|nr:hypothetical protein [Oscillospiraceae bacterium]